MNTIRTVLEYVTDTPPVPVVVIGGSGRAADLIAFTHKFAKINDEDDDELPILDQDLAEQLMAAIQSTFRVDRVQGENLLIELLQCVKKKNLITVFGSLSAESDIVFSNFSSSTTHFSGIF